MRLDQFVSQATGLSRSDAQRHIRWARVRVDGKGIIKPSVHIDPNASVSLDDVPIVLPKALYFMLNKPAGVLSATEDASQRTVMDFIQHSHRHTLHIVGRLDKDTTGLLLISNDGDWSHRISSPKYHIPKTYCASLAEPLSESAAEQLRKGVLLHGETQAVQASTVTLLSDQQVRLTIHQGKYHQVKRMFAAVGNRVLSLHREQIGGLSLPAALAEGEWRELIVAEHALLLTPIHEHEA